MRKHVKRPKYPTAPPRSFSSVEDDLECSGSKLLQIYDTHDYKCLDSEPRVLFWDDLLCVYLCDKNVYLNYIQYCKQNTNSILYVSRLLLYLLGTALFPK